MPTVASALAYIAQIVERDDPTRSDYDRRQAEYAARRLPNFQAAIAKAEQALAAGRISNPDFLAIKDTISRVIEAVQRLAGAEYGYLHHLAGRLRKASTKPAERAFIIEVLPIADLLAALKPMIVKRQPKPVEDTREKYLAPRAGNDARALVQRALLQVTEDSYQEVLQEILRFGQEAAADYLKFEQIARQTATRRTQNWEIVRAYRKVNPKLNLLKLRVVDHIYDLPADKRAAKIEAMATKDADKIRERFVIKNLVKLDSVIERKGDFTGIETLSRTVSLYSLEGRFRVTFRDGSVFEVNNGVVFSVSPLGTPFHRFPLTFHNVVLANGSRMLRPSEERMNTEFAA